jgi:hypothetical protein
MLSITRMRLVAFVLAVAFSAVAVWTQRAGGGDYFEPKMPRRRASDLKPGSVVQPMTPEFALWDAEKQIEQDDGYLVRLVAQSRWLRSEASKTSVVSLRNAEWFFSNPTKIDVRSPFASLMPAVARRVNGDLDRAMPDLSSCGAVRLSIPRPTYFGEGV